MDRRLAPAMRTCESAAGRLETLASRVGRASNLLRTRVDIELEAQNRDVLMSMNRRARLQLRLQETVEGLSVVAISYYVVGLVGYAAKARSEEHTSELQSLMRISYAVFCLKKKKTRTTIIRYI